MNYLENIIITDIEPPFVVHSEKGKKVRMTDRKFFGLSLCLDGQITYTMNGKKYISNQSNAVLLPIGGTYSLIGDKEGFFPLINFKCENLRNDKILVFPLENPQECIRIFENIKNMFLQNKSSLKIYSAFYELLSKVDFQNPKKLSIFQTIFTYIEENISNCELSNETIAEHVGISEVYLRKLFNSYYQTTPKQYILDVRIKKAQQLLVDTPFSVTAIAEKCGFSNPYHFCRAFKNKTKTTPTEYSRQNRIYEL